MMRLFTLVFLMCSAYALSAQKVLQIEKYGDPKTEKIHIGTIIDYRLEGEESFREGYIEDFRVEDSLIVMGDRYVNIHDIAELRFRRTWGRAIGTSLMIFGGSWSGFALLGYALDNDPSTSYSGTDAAISVVSAGLGYALARLIRYRKVRMGKRYRLRLLDLRFTVDPKA
ncbi:MAG: hypothetical protein HRU12_06695 [Phaeodactylibacter sp.]|nr:hypothetical protein [Phaeodactylibacter sp.]